MLVHFTEFLKEASQQRYAVGSFNGYNYETFQGIIAAGQEMQAPIILAFGAKYLQNMSFKEASALARLFAADSPDSVCLHLDHCSELATVFQAIQSGFNSVMYDGSALSFGENVTNTKLVCDVAHACGVSVEAELGSIAAGAFSHEGSETDREIFTDPIMAAEFVAATGVDALAVSIGTVHGLYTAKPQLRFDILAEIQQLVSVPLVLHGGSGLSEVDISRCIAGGIAKINVNTEISMQVIAKTRECLAQRQPHFSELSSLQTAFVKEAVREFMAQFKRPLAVDET